MANKFQKSVLERLEQEAARQKQEKKAKPNDAIKGPQESLIDNQAVNIVEEPETSETEKAASASEQQPAAETATVITEAKQPEKKSGLPMMPDIGEYLRRDTQRLAKNKTFYLDADVIETVKSTAKAQKVTDSKLVNDILRRVLGL